MLRARRIYMDFEGIYMDCGAKESFYNLFNFVIIEKNVLFECPASSLSPPK
jgi:hypothetical protein